MNHLGKNTEELLGIMRRRSSSGMKKMKNDMQCGHWSWSPSCCIQCSKQTKGNNPVPPEPQICIDGLMKFVAHSGVFSFRLFLLTKQRWKLSVARLPAQKKTAHSCCHLYPGCKIGSYVSIKDRTLYADLCYDYKHVTSTIAANMALAACSFF